MNKIIFIFLFSFNTSIFSNTCGSPFTGWRPPPRWHIITDELEKAGKKEFHRPVQVRKKCSFCKYAGYDELTGYIWIKYNTSMLVPEAESQFRAAIRKWISNAIEYSDD